MSEALQQAGIDTRAVAQKLTDAYLQQILAGWTFSCGPASGQPAGAARTAIGVS